MSPPPPPSARERLSGQQGACSCQHRCQSSGLASGSSGLVRWDLGMADHAYEKLPSIEERAWSVEKMGHKILI